MLWKLSVVFLSLCTWETLSMCPKMQAIPLDKEQLEGRWFVQKRGNFKPMKQIGATCGYLDLSFHEKGKS